MAFIKTIFYSSVLSFSVILSAEENDILTDLSHQAIQKPYSDAMLKDKKPDSRIVKNFSFLDIKGHKHALNDYPGKWIIVNYWASYCPPCRVEVTDIDIFARENKNKAVVLGMDAGGDPADELLKFKKEFNLSYPLIPAQKSTMLAFGGVEALPTTYIISPQGKLIEKHVGMITYDDLKFYTNPPKTQLSRK